jgi:hypothetical protein
MIGRSLFSTGSVRIHRGFAESVCIMAGYPSMDHVGARLMRGLKKRSADKLEFFGLGGEKMIEAGLSENLADVNKLKDKPLYIFNNAHPHHRERLYAIYMIAVRYKNYKVIKQIEKELYGMLFEKDPLAVLTLGNEYFMKRLYLMTEKKYHENRGSNKMKPPMVFYDRFMVDQRYDNLYYLDHFIYDVPRNPINRLHYIFPSTYTGSQGLFDAYSYLYSQNKEFSGLADEKGIYLSPESNDILMDELILKSRQAFRSKHSIPESATVFFASAGSDANEVKACGKLFLESVEHFLSKYSKVGPENFVAILSVPQGKRELTRPIGGCQSTQFEEFEVQTDDCEPSK